MMRLVAILIVLFSWPILSLAQDNGFFPQDYAKSPVDEHKEPLIAKEPLVTPVPSPTVPKGYYKIPSWVVSPETNATPTEEKSVMEMAGGLEILKVGAIVNGEELPHMEDKFKELYEASDKFHFKIGSVYCIGGMNNMMMSKAAAEVAYRDGTIKYMHKPPKKYNVDLSPTWIFYTPEGKYVLEATGPLTEVINPQGKFVPFKKAPIAEEGKEEAAKSEKEEKKGENKDSEYDNSPFEAPPAS